MVRRKRVPKSLRVKYALARDLGALRLKLFGDHGAGEMARRLGLPVQTWQKYERGNTVPAEVVLMLLEMFPAEAIRPTARLGGIVSVRMHSTQWMASVSGRSR